MQKKVGNSGYRLATLKPLLERARAHARLEWRTGGGVALVWVLKSIVVARLLKFLHEIGAIGLLGSFAAAIVLLATAPPGAAAFAAAAQGVAALTKWLLVPSLAVVLITGLLCIAANDAYKNAGWAWLKALLGVSMFEGTLVTVAGGARHVAEAAALAVTGGGDAAQLAQLMHAQWNSLWVLMALSIANIVLAVWRPRLTPRSVA